MAKYLDYDGLLYFWQQLKPKFAAKVDKVDGKGLSTNDFTTAEKNKLAGIAAGAEVNVNADWDAATGDAAILNKPTIPTKTSDLTNDSNFVTDANYVHTDNNFTTTLKNKLNGIAAGAEVNVNADWDASSGDAQILNKPTIYVQNAEWGYAGSSSGDGWLAKLTVKDTVGNKIAVIPVFSSHDDGNTVVVSYGLMNDTTFTGYSKSTLPTTDYVSSAVSSSMASHLNSYADKFVLSISNNVASIQYTDGVDTNSVKFMDFADLISKRHPPLILDTDGTRAVQYEASTVNPDMIQLTSFINGGFSVITFTGTAGTDWTLQNGAVTIIELSDFVLTSTMINGHSLVSNINLTAADVGALPSSTTIPTASTTNPLMDGTASYGSGTSYARSNHVHPTDTSRAPLASPALTGTPTAPTATAGTNTTQIATTAFVTDAIATAVTGSTAFQGTVSAQATISGSNYKKGWYWVVDTAGTYVGQTCEVGDMIYAIKDKGSAYAASDFSVVQTNLDIIAITNSEIDTILAA